MKPPSINRKHLLAAAVLLCALALILVLQRAGRDDSPPSPVTTADGQPPANPRSAAPDRGRAREADRLLAAEGVRTDVSLATFPIKEYRRVSPPAGKAAGAPPGEAYIHVPSAGRRIAMEANQLGEFPTVATRLSETVGVRLSLDAVKPGTPVRVVILDGGTFPTAEGVSQVLEAAEWRGVAFEYTTSANIGTHRILVQAVGQASRILDFNALAADES